MFSARNGIIPPKEWIYDPNIKDEDDDETVAYCLE